jgi:hypothetical protein
LHCADLHDKKQKDYGRKDDPFANVRSAEEWGIEPWIGAMNRATDKVKRLQQFAQTGTLENEGVLDSFDDLIVYAGIAKVLYLEAREGETPYVPDASDLNAHTHDGKWHTHVSGYGPHAHLAEDMP